MCLAQKKQSSRCPECLHEIRPSKHIFRREFQCPECGVRLYISLAYLRTLFVVAELIGLVLSGLMVGIRNPIRLFLFGIPLGFAALMILVRLVPFFRLPAFLLRDPEHSTNMVTLDLANPWGRNHITVRSNHSREETD